MNQRETLLGILGDGRVLRWRDLPSVSGAPLSRRSLRELIADGTVVPEAGGYRLAAVSDTTTERFTELAVRHPGGVLCLYTAMRFADHLDPSSSLTDETGTTDTVALPRSRNGRTIPGARVVRWQDPRMFEIGVIETTLGGNRILHTSPARTVADLFRPKHGIPAGDAISALGNLAKSGGEDAVRDAMAHARELGWGSGMRAAVLATREMLRCVPKRA